ncbi:hypothetical protein Q7O_002591 [Pectobacterium carotovorum subsp. carotovorum PCCS1]|nr:hypothetical protein [Pectobacterium carotovorum subsp. carotovorum PCCS1]
MANHPVTDNSESDFVHFCLKFASSEATLSRYKGRLLMYIKLSFIYFFVGMLMILLIFY